MMSIRRIAASLVVATLASTALTAGSASSALPPPPPKGLPEIHEDGFRRGSIARLRNAIEASRRLSAQPSSTVPQTEEFKPISELPPEEKLPAAPMLVAAYIFVLLAFFAYVLSIARRMRSVTQEIARLETDLKRHGRN